MNLVDIVKFERMVNDQGQTISTLVQILRNAQVKKAGRHIAIVAEVLERRFPGWDRPQPKRGGHTPNIAIFRGQEAAFETAREGYLWLTNKLIQCKPTLFSEPSRETLSVALGKSRNYFGKTAAALFRGSVHLAVDHSAFARLDNGWYANVNLSNAQKFDILLRLAGAARVSYPDEWEWKVTGATELLADKQAATIRARQLLDELLHLDSG